MSTERDLKEKQCVTRMSRRYPAYSYTLSDQHHGIEGKRGIVGQWTVQSTGWMVWLCANRAHLGTLLARSLWFVAS
jgi:hypothetical protein